MLSTLQANPEASVPEIYNQTFHKVDTSLSKISEDSQGKIHSGCTAVTAFLRIEDAEGRQSYLKALPNLPPTPTSGKDAQGAEIDDSTSANGEVSDGQSKTSSPSRLKKALKRFNLVGHSPPHHAYRHLAPVPLKKLLLPFHSNPQTGLPSVECFMLPMPGMPAAFSVVRDGL